MTMSVKKHLWSLARMFLPAVGFILACLGAYLVSHQTENGLLWRLIPAYIAMGLGILAVLIGTFWTICHSMRSKVYHREGREWEQQIQIYSIERPSSFPPSYEESQSSQLSPETASEFMVEVDGVNVVISLAPPLYSPDGSEAPDCRWSWERPPRYSQVERVQLGEVELTEEQRFGRLGTLFPN
ncbi:transmembrane protein 252-like isoform X2 [Notolabrus celidotus]|uniref:transmembrane protein 252-like isoform X2 n=1 Tax=Notolabrus celidotus TaxID=1203425 RepID=UPI00148F9423|nr:transmembrane protein 252-like isoform X2 [Notolabrus celidotus]